MSKLIDIWHGIRDEIRNLDEVKTRGGSLVFTSRVQQPKVNQFMPAIYVEHQSSARADETKRMHTYRITIQVKGIDSVKEYEKNLDSTQARVADLAETITSGLEENTLDGDVVVGGCMVGAAGPITGIEGDKLMCGTQILVQCLAMIDDDIPPQLTRLWRIYYGTRAYSTGEYTDITDWTMLCKGLGALQHIPSEVHTAPKWSSGYAEARTYTMEERRVIALISKSNAATWGMYLGKTIADGANMPFIHEGSEFGDLPRYALLLMNKLSNGSYWKAYFPKVSCIPAADISDKAPYMTLEFEAEGDDDNLSTTSEMIIGHATQDTAKGPWT